MRLWIGVGVTVGVACGGLWVATRMLGMAPVDDSVGLAGLGSFVIAVVMLVLELSHQARDSSVPGGASSPDWVRNAVRIAQVDLTRLGVHAARPGADGGRQPPYVARDADAELDERLTDTAADPRGGMVLVTGGSMAGKSRALVAALRRGLPERRLVVPPEDAGLTDLPAWLKRHRWRGRRGWVVWLDDLERHLPHAHLSISLLEALGAAGAIVAATIRWGQLQALKPASHQQGQAVGYKVLEAPALVLDRVWSCEERARAAHSGDERLAEAADQETVGVAAYVGAGPQLELVWKHGPEAGAPRGYALVAAAVDLARTGLSAPLTRTQIEQVSEHYLPTPPPAPEDPEQAWQWATTERNGVAGLLVPADDQRWRAFDYLTSHDPIPETVWNAALDGADDQDRFAIGVTAYTDQQWAVAEGAWTPLAEKGDTSTMYNLALLLQQGGRVEEAEQWYRRATDHDVGAMFNLALLLQQDGRVEEAEQWYRRAADHDSTKAMNNLGVLLEQAGRVQEAEQSYRRAADQDSPEAMTNLGVLLQEDGRAEEAEQSYRRAADHDSTDAMNNLGLLLLQLGDRIEEAEWWWNRAAGHQHAGAMVNLALLREHGGRAEEAEQWYRRAAENGDTDAMSNLAVLLQEDGRAEEAEQWYRRAAENGDTDAMSNLAVLLEQDGRAEEAEQWYRRARETLEDSRVDPAGS